MKRKIFVSALAVCLVAIMACGSLAYFQHSATVSNKFLTASSTDPTPQSKKDLFSVEVSEPDGKGGSTLTGNTYNNAVPGQIFDKKPIVKNTGKKAQWIRISVIFNNASKWLNADEKITAATLFDEVVAKAKDSKYVASDWTRVNPTDVNADDELVYTFYYKGGKNNGKLAKDDTAVLFEKVIIPSYLEVDDMFALKEFQIDVKADAIQADNTGNTAEDTFKNCWADAEK